MMAQIFILIFNFLYFLIINKNINFYIHYNNYEKYVCLFNINKIFYFLKIIEMKNSKSILSVV